MVAKPEGDLAVTLTLTPEHVLPVAAVNNTVCSVPSCAARMLVGKTFGTVPPITAPAVHEVASVVSAVKVVPAAHGRHRVELLHSVLLLARKVSADDEMDVWVNTPLLVAIESTAWLRTVVADVLLSQVSARLGIPHTLDGQALVLPRGSTNSPESYVPFSLSSR